MSFEEIMAGRLTLIGAQRSLANRACRFDGQKLVIDRPADRAALLILHRALDALDREFTVKNCRRYGRRAA